MEQPMKNDYLLPGIAAIIIAVIFPALMIYEILDFGDGNWKSLLVGGGDWGFEDAVFLVMGLLLVFVFYNFKKILNEQLNFKSLDVLLWVLIGLSVLFHIVFLGFEAIISVTDFKNSDGLGIAFGGITLSTLVAFGVVDIIIGIIILTNHQKLPTILKALGVISIIQGVFEVSIILFFLVIISFPIYMLILAVYFLRKLETIEVV